MWVSEVAYYRKLQQKYLIFVYVYDIQRLKFRCMKNISDFYEKSGDWLFNLVDRTSNASDSTCEIKSASNAAKGSKLSELVRRFFRSIKKQEEKIRKLHAIRSYHPI